MGVWGWHLHKDLETLTGVVVHVAYMRRGIAPDGDWWLKVRPVPGDERLLQSPYVYIV